MKQPKAVRNKARAVEQAPPNKKWDSTDLNLKITTKPPVSAESVRKHQLFLQAVDKFGLLSKEALQAASEWEFQRSYLDLDKSTKI
jgi:hypothetical protein